jgi:hypothetical protein
MQQSSTLRKMFPLWLASAATLLCVCTPAASQQKVEEVATLHVYTNLLQIPVLILSQKHQALPPIEPGKFLLHVGNDPPFHPRVRLEGEDPVTLAVLIDGSFDGPNLPELGESLAAMARDQLHRQDRIALYGMDGCKLRRTSALLPPDANLVRTAVQKLEAFPPYVHRWRGQKCDNPTRLWDALSLVNQFLQGEPGRRVVLVITNGVDGGSKLGADEARLVATRNGVAVFAVAERSRVRMGYVSSPSVSVGGNVTSGLAYIAEGTGGMVMETTRNNVAETLTRFPELLRGRYILEFSRPIGMTAGAHFLTVSVGQPKDFIRPAGTSMPVADPEAPDPSVQHGKLGEVRDPVDPPKTDATQAEPAPATPDHAVPAAPHTMKLPVLTPVRKPVADPTDISDDVQSAATNPGRP